MLGYHIGVYRQPIEVYDGEEVKRIDRLTPAAAPKDPSSRSVLEGAPGFLPTFERYVIASWYTDYDGLDWIEDLVKTGKAIRLQGGGWPSLYTATAENLISQIIDGPPKAKDYLSSGVGQQSANAAACSPDEWLWIKAWDQD